MIHGLDNELHYKVFYNFLLLILSEFLSLFEFMQPFSNNDLEQRSKKRPISDVPFMEFEKVPIRRLKSISRKMLE